MPQQTTQSIETNFSKGLITEATGLTFPENAVTNASNCLFNRLGNVTRRLGIDYEDNHIVFPGPRAGSAISTYKWNNVGGDGLTQIVAVQIGGTLHFWRSSSATVSVPLSGTKLGTIDLSTFIVGADPLTSSIECQFADGNGYLFVYHPNLQPFYCSYNAGTITATAIAVEIRDFAGIPESDVKAQTRPMSLTAEHRYNLANQGWSSSPVWGTTSSSSVAAGVGSKTFTVGAGLPVVIGQIVQVQVNDPGHGSPLVMTGTVTSYAATTIIISMYYAADSATYSSWILSPVNLGLIDTWHTAEGNYPSNADVWWRFKDSTGAFNPATTQPNVTLDSGPAPKGFYLVSAFDQNRTAVSGISGLTEVYTFKRPSTGTWFQGRVWYAGLDASQAATGDEPYFTWTENIYFSQTVVDSSQFGMCYQNNDPTSETLFDLLPTDGGVITIQGSGSIYKLFPVQNGLIVFAANGVWYITGSQGIGFAANDYTVTKLSSIQAISYSSIVDVQGLPVWWNEEGIYKITNQQDGTPYGGARGASGNGNLSVQPVTYTTIQSFYQDIPLTSKKYVKGTYDPLNWEIKWAYKTTEETSTTDRYQYDGILVFNTTTQAFSPWTIASAGGSPWINGLVYVQGPGGSTSPEPMIKYLTSKDASTYYEFTFSEEKDTTYTDWVIGGSAANFTSYFVSGYKLMGQAQKKFQSEYVHIYLNNNVNMSYRMQGIWDFAINRNSNKYTSLEMVAITDSTTNFSVVQRRHKIRGRGLALQFKITSVDGAPFDILGWSVDMKVNAGV